MTRILKWLLLLLVFIAGGYFVAEWRMKIEVQEFLNQKVPNHIDFSYAALQINLLKGHLRFQDIEVFSRGRQTSSCEILVNAKQLSIDGFSYRKLFFDKSIYLKKLSLSKPQLNFKTCPKDTANSVSATKPINLLKPIFIEELVFDSGAVAIWNAAEEIELLSVKSIDLSFKDITTDPKIINKYVPFEFSDYTIGIHGLKAPLGEFEQLKMGSMVLDTSGIELKNVALATLLSKTKLSKKIKVERDHVNLVIPTIFIKEHAYTMENDTLNVLYNSLTLSEPKLELYRDKALPNNLERRPLYSEMLRKLPFKIAIDSVSIEEATVRYEEEAPNISEAGILTFEHLNAKITNLSNRVTSTANLKTTITAELMGAGLFELDWEFDVQDKKDAFKISGALSNLNTALLNDFLVPNLGAKAHGEIDQLYFTISGDQYVATGDIKMRYEDFKFQVLNKDRSHVKKVLSFIGNLFVNDGSKADEHGYRYGDIATERPKNKSFFNYLWVNLEDGLLDVLTGNGKKE